MSKRPSSEIDFDQNDHDHFDHFPVFMGVNHSQAKTLSCFTLFLPLNLIFSLFSSSLLIIIATFAAEIRHRGGIQANLKHQNQFAVMEATMKRTVFSPAQVEILNTISQLHSEEDLQELRHWLARFFAMRADRELERLWNEGVITEQTIEDWGKEHMRTPYRSNKFVPA